MAKTVDRQTNAAGGEFEQMEAHCFTVSLQSSAILDSVQQEHISKKKKKKHAKKE